MSEPPHILVVDDHREIRDAVTRYLEKNGMRATSARDAVDMDAKLANGKYVVAIGDPHVVNDPLMGQGVGCATNGAFVVGQAILDDGLAFEFFERQLKLSDLGIELLGRLAELHPLEARNLHAQRIDQDVAGGNIGVGSCQCSFKLGDPSVFIRGGKACVRHHDHIADRWSKR